jgi:molybdopterin converting factor subunit 1
MRVTIRLFARLRELIGSGEMIREAPSGATIRTVWNGLVAEYPSIAPYSESMSCAINAEYARMTTPVSDGDEVAFLPPVSGGAGGYGESGAGTPNLE